MVQTHLASRTPYLELYVQFSSPNDAFAASTSTAVREEYTAPARHSVSGWQNTEAPGFGSSTDYTTPARHSVSGWDMHLSESISNAGIPTSDWGRYETFRRRDDVLPMTSTGEGTSYVAADGRSDDKSDVDPPREPRPDSVEVALFSEPEPVPTKAEEGSNEEEEYLRFRAYSPPTHMHNVDLSEDDVLEFPDLPHRRRDCASSSLDSGELEVGKEFSNKDSFLGVLKQHSIMNGVNYNVLKSKSDKFEAKCEVKDGTCAWKIMASLRKRIGLWEIKKYKGPYTCVGGYEISKDLFHEMLTQAYDSGLRYGHMTTNLAECINSILKGTRHLPVTSVVRETYFRLAALFPKRAVTYKGQMQGGHVWCHKVLQAINKSKARVNTMYTVCYDRDNLWFRVTEYDIPNQCITGGQYRVHLRNKTCDCGRFDALHYPCAHAIAACQNLRLDPMSYVDDVYKIEYMYNVWRHVFPPVPDERKWSSVSLAPFKLLPDRELRRKPKGRPCSSRIRNNMDLREITNQQKLCGWCRNPGHTSRSCPNRNG
ncbi:hypothetical protein J1N35_023271 [Gossypium stocksii]|uniref:SWIM-type domain-containing protein n=1 Tax=Gossypium stocksii TaxID=47602 RepID=A0A9D3VHK8_9ROSI|nr:hypothetical protein J1N35_023271 [Gossypium stocksii]